MSHITWQFVQPLEDPGAVEAFEGRYGVAVPDELAALIRLYNGGYPSPCRCPLPGGGETDFKLLLSYNPQDPETVYEVADYFLKASRNRLLPFGSDSGSGYFCVEGSGEVCYVQETALGRQALAPSLEDFLLGLY